MFYSINLKHGINKTVDRILGTVYNDPQITFEHLKPPEISH